MRDFGPVRTYRCYPSHAFGVGPSRSRCHGRLRRPKSLTHPALSYIIFIFLAFLCLRDNAPHFLLGNYLCIRPEPGTTVKVISEIRSCISRNISVSGDTEEVHRTQCVDYFFCRKVLAATVDLLLQILIYQK